MEHHTKRPPLGRFFSMVFVRQLELPEGSLTRKRAGGNQITVAPVI